MIIDNLNNIPMSLKKCVAQLIKGYIRRLQTLAPSQ